MDGFLEDAQVQEAALCVLLQLSETVPGRRAIHSEGAVHRVFAAMDAHIKNEQVCEGQGAGLLR
jgi:hypothetical protein